MLIGILYFARPFASVGIGYGTIDDCVYCKNYYINAGCTCPVEGWDCNYYPAGNQYVVHCSNCPSSIGGEIPHCYGKPSSPISYVNFPTFGSMDSGLYSNTFAVPSYINKDSIIKIEMKLLGCGLSQSARLNLYIDGVYTDSMDLTACPFMNYQCAGNSDYIQHYNMKTFTIPSVADFSYTLETENREGFAIPKDYVNCEGDYHKPMFIVYEQGQTPPTFLEKIIMQIKLFLFSITDWIKSLLRGV